MDIVRFDAGSSKLPRVRISALPTFSFRSVQLRRQGCTPEQKSDTRHRWYSRSRYALTDALRACGVGPNAAVLIPAYHCRTMVDPGLRLNTTVQLYSLHRDLTVDFAALESLLNKCQPQPVALLAVHFFGIQQDMSRLQALCQSYGITLIEDCSHCFWHPSMRDQLGRVGRYSIWSPYKFYPCEDGGILQANDGASLPSSTSLNPPWRKEAEGVYRLLNRSRKQIQTADQAFVSAAIDQAAGSDIPLGQDLVEWRPGPSDQYVSAAEHCQPLAVSRWIIRYADTERIRNSRRARYSAWANLVASFSGCRPLYSSLPNNCVPYMFPLQVDQPDRPFRLLKRLGFPVWRWDNMVVSACKVAHDYRSQVFQLPCHQELSGAEFSWMLHALGSVLHNATTK